MTRGFAGGRARPPCLTWRTSALRPRSVPRGAGQRPPRRKIKIQVAPGD